MLENIKESKTLQILSYLFMFFLLWRAVLFFYPPTPDEFNVWSFAWGATYQLIALFGAISGFIVARAWGGWKSMLGRVIIAFSLGLLMQSVGQAIASYYVYHTGEVPYPAWDDLGFFGSVLAYIYGVIILARVSGTHISLKPSMKKIQAAIVPIILLVGSYLIFLKGYEFDWTDKIKVFLDFGYPLGQAFYIAVAILVYLLSKNTLGGVMRKPVLLVIVALVIQYISDFTFLYQATNGLYIPEGVNDFMYFISYFFMALSLTQIGVMFYKIKNS